MNIYLNLKESCPKDWGNYTIKKNSKAFLWTQQNISKIWYLLNTNNCRI